MTSKKYQLRLGQKVHGPIHNGQVQNDLSKMTKRFFWCLSKMGLFLPKFIVKNIRNSSSDLL
jgi:hypothetical protein